MSSLQSPGSFYESFGDLSFEYSNRKLRVLLKGTQAPPEAFGMIVRSLAEIPKFALQEMLDSIDIDRGGLTLEQDEFLQKVDPTRIIQTCEDEYLIVDERAEYIAWALPRLFVRAYPLVPTLNIDIDCSYDGFYGPAYMGPPLPLALNEYNIREFTKSVFGEHRRSFMRAITEVSVTEFAAMTYLASLIQNPDLMQEVLQIRTDFQNAEVLGFCKHSELSGVLQGLRKSTLKNLLLDQEEARDSVVSNLVEIAALLDAETLESIRASSWDDLLVKASQAPSSYDKTFPISEDIVGFEGKTVGGYELHVLDDRLSLARAAQSLKNCLFEAKYTRRAADGQFLYFSLIKNGDVVGAVELGYSNHKWVVMQLEGVSNAVLSEHSDIEKQISSLMNKRKVL